MRSRPELEVLATGPRALIQDRGRTGLAALGVGRSGAADRRSFELGARLLAQDDSFAAVEVTLGGLTVRVRGQVMVALTGAPAPARVGEIEAAYCSPLSLADGDVLHLGVPPVGLRSYLSVRGGLDVPPVLGSRATDTLSGLGPQPLQVGDVLPVGPPPRQFPLVDVAPVRPLGTGPITVHALLGPREDWLDDPHALATTTWTVSSRSDRIGVRLEGQPLHRSDSKSGLELPSEGVVRGAIQIPPGGEPVLFLSDHPVTGGYPVAAVVTEADVDLAAQALPGQTVRIVLVGQPARQD